MTTKAVRGWLCVVASAVCIPVVVGVANSAEVSLKSGDVLVGRIAPDPVRMQVGRDTRSFPVSDLREWRAYRLTLTDGTVLTRSRFLDTTLSVTTRFGASPVSTDDIGSLIFVTPSAAAGAAGPSALTDFQKETVKTISGLTLQFVVIAVGVFSLAGAYLVRGPGYVIRPWPSIGAGVALGSIALSVVAGYFVHGAIVGQLDGQHFSAYASLIQDMAAVQLALFLAGGLLFSGVAWHSARNRGVAFRLESVKADRITLVGTFNNWGQLATRARYQLHRWPWSERWGLRVELPPGSYEYLFLAETPGGTSWISDPNCQIRVANPYGGQNCVITVVGGKAL